ncbi:hypothetical protein ACTD5D_10105 [Nocardia takedensis]|uniref:hypothetical protein n=1 Tax=Nocardia takedensis TaxID=259390 RepID=UPI003F766E99
MSRSPIPTVSDPDSVYAALAGGVVELADELSAWARPAREFAHDLRLTATPRPDTEAARRAPWAVAARRARHTPRPVGAVTLRHPGRDARTAARRRRAEAELDAYFARHDAVAA